MPRISREQLLHHLVNDVYVRVGPSKIHGVGLIAIRDIPKGTDPFKNMYDPQTFGFTQEELQEVPIPVQKMVNDYFGKEDGKIYIPTTGLNPLDLLHFINHSETPNVHTVNEGWIFRAIRDIALGEELFSDYSTYDEDYLKYLI